MDAIERTMRALSGQVGTASTYCETGAENTAARAAWRAWVGQSARAITSTSKRVRITLKAKPETTLTEALRTRIVELATNDIKPRRENAHIAVQKAVHECAAEIKQLAKALITDSSGQRTLHLGHERLAELAAQRNEQQLGWGGSLDRIIELGKLSTSQWEHCLATPAWLMRRTLNDEASSGGKLCAGKETWIDRQTQRACERTGIEEFGFEPAKLLKRFESWEASGSTPPMAVAGACLSHKKKVETAREWATAVRTTHRQAETAASWATAVRTTHHQTETAALKERHWNRETGFYEVRQQTTGGVTRERVPTTTIVERFEAETEAFNENTDEQMRYSAVDLLKVNHRNSRGDTTAIPTTVRAAFAWADNAWNNEPVLGALGAGTAQPVWPHDWGGSPRAGVRLMAPYASMRALLAACRWVGENPVQEIRDVKAMVCTVSANTGVEVKKRIARSDDENDQREGEAAAQAVANILGGLAKKGWRV